MCAERGAARSLRAAGYESGQHIRARPGDTPPDSPAAPSRRCRRGRAGAAQGGRRRRGAGGSAPGWGGGGGGAGPLPAAAAAPRASFVTGARVGPPAGSRGRLPGMEGERVRRGAPRTSPHHRRCAQLLGPRGTWGGLNTALAGVFKFIFNDTDSKEERFPRRRGFRWMYKGIFLRWFV